MTLPNADLDARIVILTDRLEEDIVSSVTSLSEEASGNRLRRSSFITTRQDTRAGLKDTVNKLKGSIRSLRGDVETKLAELLETMKLEALAITPKKTGLLRENAYSMTDRLKTRVRGSIGYSIIAGPVPPGVKTGARYAIFVHEMPMSGIKWTTPGTQSKFLQVVLDRHEATFAETLRAEVEIK